MKELYLESAKGGTSHEQNRCIGLHKQKKGRTIDKTKQKLLKYYNLSYRCHSKLINLFWYFNCDIF